MRASLTRTVSFHATHRLYRADWTPEQNRERFGWTADAPGHAHDYRCAVTVSGEPDAGTGMLLDLAQLDAVLDDVVVAPFEGKHINLDIPEFGPGRLLSTCEGLAAYFYGKLEGRIPAGLTLDRVRVAEDDTLHAEVRRGPG